MLKNIIKVSSSIAKAGKTKNALDIAKAGVDTIKLIDKATKKKRKKQTEDNKKQLARR